ncbi:MAG: PAS domain S-box protein [Nitrospirae bacterium]|nr:MAG: PAS domain S-box protein [Nitrospirota bacterium]
MKKSLFFIILASILEGSASYGLFILTFKKTSPEYAIYLSPRLLLFFVVIFLIPNLALLLWGTEVKGKLNKIVEHLRRLPENGQEMPDSDLPGPLIELGLEVKRLSRRINETLKQDDRDRGRFEKIIQDLPDAITVIDEKNRISIANTALYENITDRDVRGEHFYEVFRWPETYELIDKVRDTGKTQQGELRIDQPVEKVFSLIASPIGTGSEHTQPVVLLFHDITTLKRLEQMRQDFVANVSHEIKTPVTAIKGFAETLLDGAIDDRENAISFLQTIRRNSERLHRLVEDLLMLSRIELGVIKIDKREITLNEVFKHVEETLRPAAEEKGLGFFVSLKDRQTVIEADRNRLIQILLNIVDNAIKFTRKGSIEMGYEERDGQGLIYVEDTGIGIPEQLIPRLGERFFRVDPSRSRELGGTGLGLAIVKHLVKAHGWELGIKSKEETGTRVEIYL